MRSGDVPSQTRPCFFALLRSGAKGRAQGNFHHLTAFVMLSFFIIKNNLKGWGVLSSRNAHPSPTPTHVVCTRTRLCRLPLLPLDVDEKKEGKKKKTKKKKKKSKKKVSDDMGDEFYNSDSKIAAPFVHVGKAPEPAELLAKMQLDVPAVETSEQASKEEDRPTSVLNRKNTKGTMVAEPEPMPSFLAHGKPKSEPGNCASSCDKNTCGGVSPDLYVDDGFGGKIKKKDKKRRTKPENDVSVEDYAKQIGWEKVPRDSSTEEGLARVTEVLESAKQKLKCPEPGPETGWPPPGMEIVNDRHALPRLKSVLTAIEVIEHVSSEEEMLLEHRDKHGYGIHPSVCLYSW